MAKFTAIQKAIDAIGEKEPDDWRMDPQSHAQLYENRAPKLSHILSMQNVADTAQQYNEADKRAGNAQCDFKGTVRNAGKQTEDDEIKDLYIHLGNLVSMGLYRGEDSSDKELALEILNAIKEVQRN